MLDRYYFLALVLSYFSNTKLWKDISRNLRMFSKTVRFIRGSETVGFIGGVSEWSEKLKINEKPDKKNYHLVLLLSNLQKPRISSEKNGGRKRKKHRNGIGIERKEKQKVKTEKRRQSYKIMSETFWRKGL